MRKSLKGLILKYKVDENFFLKFDNARLSKMYDNGEVITDYEVVEEIPYFYDQYTSEDLTTLIKQAGNEYNVPMCEKLAVLFNYDITGVKKEEYNRMVTMPVHVHRLKKCLEK